VSQRLRNWWTWQVYQRPLLPEARTAGVEPMSPLALVIFWTVIIALSAILGLGRIGS
jgi:hypothetical protein